MLSSQMADDSVARVTQQREHQASHPLSYYGAMIQILIGLTLAWKPENDNTEKPLREKKRKKKKRSEEGCH